MLQSIVGFVAAGMRTVGRRVSRGPRVPSWSFAFEAVVDFLRADWDATADWDLVRQRAAMDGKPYPSTFVRRARVRDVVLAESPTRIYEAPDARDDAAILFFHGGSCVYGSAKTTHAELMAQLALETRVPVWGVDYRLAPEHPFPAQRDDAVAAFEALQALGVPAERIAFAGDSAGGNVAVTAALALRDRGSRLPKALVLLSPWIDLEMPGASFVENAAFDFGTRDVLVRHAKAFAGSIPLDDPAISPVHANLAELPSTLVSWGTREIPRDDVVRFAEALRAAGVPLTTHAAADMPHNPTFFAAWHPSGRAALDAVVAFIARELRPATA